MSRLGKKPISIPEGTQVTLEGDTVRVKGPKGELEKRFSSQDIVIEEKEGEIILVPKKGQEKNPLWGTYSSLIRSMVSGVNELFEKKLILEGVGYRVELAGSKLKLIVGYSHPVELDVPEGLEVTVEKNEITVKGVNKELVGQFTAKVRATKKPEPYKGKGLRYHDEVIRRKEGKKSV